MMLAFKPEHPSSDLLDALDERLLEALAVAASELTATVPAGDADKARLVKMGLALANGHPTAAGYAVLLAWHRRFVTQGKTRWLYRLFRTTRHEVRMRLLWRA